MIFSLKEIVCHPNRIFAQKIPRRQSVEEYQSCPPRIGAGGLARPAETLEQWLAGQEAPPGGAEVGLALLMRPVRPLPVRRSWDAASPSPKRQRWRVAARLARWRHGSPPLLRRGAPDWGGPQGTQ
jgi:hypothetical protein